MNLKIFFVAFLLSLPFWWGINYFQKNLENYFYAQISQPLEDLTFVKIPPKTEKPELSLLAKSVISIKINQAGRQKILSKKNINQPLPIASLTKLMTAVIALEDPENYNFLEPVAISKKAASQENAPGDWSNLTSGENRTVKNLLELMLIYSSNDAAWALAEVIDTEDTENTENFVEKMNQKAKDLGLGNTHFVNPHGLDPDELPYEPSVINYFNHSSAKDLVKLSRYILKEHPLIFEISKKEPLYRVEDGILKLFLTQEVVGGKTGYTDEAGGCILFVFKDEKGSFFINLILGAPSAPARIEEMQKLINWLNL